MNLYKSKCYQNDLSSIICAFPEFEQFRNVSILITGATGLICSGVVDILLAMNQQYNYQTHLYLACRNEEKMRARFLPYLGSEYLHYVPYDANEQVDFPFAVDYIIHAAGNAYPQVIQQYPVETMLNNFRGIYELLKYAGTIHAKKVLYVSSSEVYGLKNTIDPFVESEYGVIDPLNARTSYSISKKAAETMCISYSAEYGVDASIVRPGHIYGPTASSADNRVSSSFAYLAARGQNLILKSDGSQVRSYCYVLDCATAILIALLKGASCEAYNISNPDSVISILQMAELFAKAGNVLLQFDIPSKSEAVAFNPMLNSSLDSSKLLGLGWRGLFDATSGVEHTVTILREAE